MITALEFIQGGLKQLHSNLDKQLDNITSEQLHAVPARQRDLVQGTVEVLGVVVAYPRREVVTQLHPIVVA